MYSGEYDACDVTLSVYPHRYISIDSHCVLYIHWFPPWSGIFFKLARCGYTLRVTSQASYMLKLWSSVNIKQGNLACAGFGVYVLALSPLFTCFYNTLQLLFDSPNNHLLFLVSRRHNNNIDCSTGLHSKRWNSPSLIDFQAVASLPTKACSFYWHLYLHWQRQFTFKATSGGQAK
jgi:hypothetical protein